MVALFFLLDLTFFSSCFLQVNKTRNTEGLKFCRHVYHAKVPLYPLKQSTKIVQLYYKLPVEL